MSFYTDLGGVLEFYKETIGTNSIAELTKVLFKTLNSYGVNASISYLLTDRIQNYKENGEMSPLEINVIKAARSKTRFYTYEDKLFLNYPDFTLFIKNMPKNEDRSGILRDSVGVLANGVEAQLKNIVASEKIRKNVAKAMDTEEILDQAKLIQKTMESTMASAISSLQSDMEESFLSLGLSEAQEKQIIDLINECDSEIQKGLIIGLELVEQVNKISNNLQDMRNT